jgi:hypothetical protein
MPFTSANVLSAAELLDNDLLGVELLDDLGDDARPFDDGSADCGAVGAGNEQDSRENEFGAEFTLAVIDEDAIPFADPRLMAAVLNDCVHPSKLLESCSLALRQVLDSTVAGVLDLVPRRGPDFIDAGNGMM